ncbi:MAG: LTA synthase family protein [Clostridiales bacterium]|nr:LTA synthase family protein [Clostridiales bacterium]
MGKRQQRAASYWGWLIFSGIGFVLVAVTLIRFQAFRTPAGVWYRKRMVLYMVPVALTLLLSLLSPDRKKCRKKGFATLQRGAFMAVGIVLGTLCFQGMCWQGEWLVAIPQDPVFLGLALLLTTAVYMTVWALVWDARVCTMAAYWFLYVCGYAYACVYQFRGVTFKPMDLLTLETALAVAGNYRYPLEANHVFWACVGVLLCRLSSWVPREKSRAIGMRLGKLAGLAVTGGVIAFLLCSPFINTLDIQTPGLEHAADFYHSRHGTLTILMKELWNLKNNKPEGYKAQALADAVPALLAPELMEGAQEKPNVLVIMDESLADLTSLWQIQTNQDPLPYLHRLRENVVYGNIYVNVYGGTTCNTEHSFLTGTLQAPQLSLPLFATVREDTPSLAWQMKAQGYATIAMHPENPANFQRNVCYPRLGFDRFLSIGDFENIEYFRKYASDRTCFQKIISLYESKPPEEKLFVFNVTMQNHSSYTEWGVANSITVENGGDTAQLSQYLTCVHASDQAFEELITYFEGQKEPVLILIFGDHQPNIQMTDFAKKESLSSIEQRLTPYITPFLIWANYPIEAEHVEGISINYLQALLLQKGGLPMTAYDKWLLDIMPQYPIVTVDGYMNSEGAFTLWSEQEPPDVLKRMNEMRYNRLYDGPSRLPALDIVRAQ